MYIKRAFLAKLGLLLSLLVSSSTWAMMCGEGANILIPDDSANGGASDANPGTPGIMTIEVPAGAVGTISDLDIQLAIDIDFPGDLIVTLTSPSGTTVTLLDRPGRPATAFGCGFGNTNIDVTLDDDAAIAAEGVCAGTPAISGVLIPTGSLSDFNGESLSGIWTLTATDFFPADQGTFLTTSNCLSATTTPVTVSSVKTRKRGKFLVFDWQTATEAFNLGFHLWGMIDGQWQQLNNRLIAAESIDSLTPTNYRKRINLLNLQGEVTAVGLSALSTAGQEDFYGPFDIGESYGEQSIPRKVDWVEQRSSYDAARIAAGYTRINNRWVFNTDQRKKRNDRQTQRYQDVVLSIRENGVYRVNYEDLLARGIDLKNMSVNKLALTRDGIPVPRFVKTEGQSKKIGPGTEIIFHATGPDTSAARYVDNARYVISLNSTKVLNINADSNGVDINGSVINQSHYDFIEYGNNNAYLFALPGNDPWYDTSIRAFGQNSSHFVTLDLPLFAELAETAELTLSLVGGFEFPRVDADGDGELEPNHHFKVYVNRNTYPDAIYEGFSNALDSVEIKVLVDGRLTHGSNVLELELIPDNGHNLDAMFYLGGSLSFVAENKFLSEYLSFNVRSNEPVIEVLDINEKIAAAYSYDADGNFSKIAFERNELTQSVYINSPYNSALDDDVGLSVWFASAQGYLQPHDIFKVPEPDPQLLTLEGIDYVVIADPSLINDDLQRFVDQQIELGRNTKVVNVDDIYHNYADGLVVPQAIKKYLAEQSRSSFYQYVLLVGGHTYNYRGYNSPVGEAPITMIPSFYRSDTVLSRQIPTAVPFVDFDLDGYPDRAIGRWPVRDQQQLKNVVNKTLRWHAQGSHKDSKTSLFIAGSRDAYNDFTGSSNRLISSLGLPDQSWPEPLTVYSDVIAEDDSVVSGEKLSHNRNLLVDSINQGPALTIFSGHGAPVSWGAQRLLNANIADQLNNSHAPSLMVPLACYTTYYEAPGVKSLSEVLLTDSEAGAVALSGAALLSSTIDNERFTRSLLRYMTVAGLDLGTAVMKVKQEMKSGGLSQQAMVFNWVTLGDPSLSFGLPDITPDEVEHEPQTERKPSL